VNNKQIDKLSVASYGTVKMADERTRISKADPLYTSPPVHEPLPEPVAWWDGLTDTSSECMVNTLREKHINIRSSTYKDFPIPLYTSPQVREPANEEAINAIFEDAYKMCKKHRLAVGGQTITLSDSTDYWIVVATEKHHGIR
jgi:hypothetical protein